MFKPATHIATNAGCETCHSGTTSFLGVIYNHAGVVAGSCATCHGVTATAKPATHIQTTLSCDACHRTTAWLPASFNHTGVTAACATCHNGTSALGKPANHIPTNMACNTCHKSTTSFSGTTMSHTGIVTGCVNCHNGAAFAGVTPVSKPATHVATNADCYTCHKNTTSFLGAGFDHTGIAAGTCATCHGVTPGVKAMPVGTHVPTTVSCDVCHTNTTTFTASKKPNHALLTGTCRSCHGSKFTGVVSASHNAPKDCNSSGCHSTSTFSK